MKVYFYSFRDYFKIVILVNIITEFYINLVNTITNNNIILVNRKQFSTFVKNYNDDS